MIESSPNLAPAAVERLATVIQFPRRPWWASAPNPACVDWCEVEHDPNEFANHGALLCERTFSADHPFTVQARSFVEPHEDGTPAKLDARRTHPFVDIPLGVLGTPGEADALVAAIREASAICDRPAKVV